MQVQANQLRRGDVIVPPDGPAVRVTVHVVYGTATGWVRVVDGMGRARELVPTELVEVIGY